MTDIAEMDAYDASEALEVFAKENGFSAPQAYYISGSFHLKDEKGGTVAYSDESHLWCECCADNLLEKVKATLTKAECSDLEIRATRASCVDTPPHCMECGETLRGTLSDCCVEDEIAYYLANPIDPEDEVNPRMAVELAQLIWAAGDREDALLIGRAALVAIAHARELDAAVPG
jgi:hypothetical protein